MIRYFSRRLRRVARDVQQRTGSMSHVLEEIVGAQRVVKIFGGQRTSASAPSRAPTACASR